MIYSNRNWLSAVLLVQVFPPNPIPISLIEQCIGLNAEDLVNRNVDVMDIAYDELQAKHYKETEDPKFFKSKRTGRGPLVDGWRETFQPIMCSYKLVACSFEVWGLQSRVEDYAQRVSDE